MNAASVLILDGECAHAIGVIQCLAQARMRAHVISTTPRCPARYSRHCASFHRVPDDDARVDAVIDIYRRTGARVALPLSETSVEFCVRHRERLSNSEPTPTPSLKGRESQPTPGPSLKGRECMKLPPLADLADLKCAGDKGALAELMRRSGIAHPLTTSLEDATRLPLPLLIKPTTGTGGQGIELIENQEMLRARLAKGGDREFSYIAQEYIAGRDVGVNVLCRDGVILAHTVQRSSVRKPGEFVPGTILDFVDHHAALDLARRLMSALSWSGVANIDMREDECGNVHVLEVNPRYWSTLLGSLYAGVNFPVLHCLAALGQDFEPPSTSCVRYHSSHVSGLKDVRSGSVWQYTITDPPPEVCRQMRRLAGRI